MATTLTDSSVRLTLGTVDIARTLSLSPDGKTLTVTPLSKFTAPSTISLTLTNSITDLASNALTPPINTWSWSVPVWLPWSTANEATTTINSDFLYDYQVSTKGTLTGIWFVLKGSNREHYVRYWDNGDWKPLGGPLGSDTGNTNITIASIILDSSEKPIVAWSGGSATSSTLNVYVRKWETDHWEALGAELSAYPGQTNAIAPRLFLDNSNNPVVAWSESDGTLGKICLMRWLAGAWQPIGECINDLAQSYSEDDKRLVVRFDATNAPVMAWVVDNNPPTVNVQRLETTGWNLFTPLTTDAQDPYFSMQLGTLGNPFVTTLNYDGVSYSIEVDQWDDPADVWDSLGFLSAFPGNTPTYDHSIMQDLAGNPIVAFTEGDAQGKVRLQVNRKRDGDWESLSEELSSKIAVHTVNLMRRATFFYGWIMTK